ncbi:MAG: peptidyl-dipeptidase [Acidobacteria bacterium]|nr:peptidyl-dipeptidase [Acidobacteriota bacterium]
MSMPRSRSSRRLAVALAGALATMLDSPVAAQPQGPPTVEEAQSFLVDAEARLLDLWIQRERASWVQSTYITYDTELLAARANEETIKATMELARAATRYDALELPEPWARKLRLLKIALTLPAPSDAAQRAELTQIAARMEGTYGRGKWCPGEGKECLDIAAISDLLAASRDPKELEAAWQGWHDISTHGMREDYRRFVELGNAGARELGFQDLGALWRSKYDLDPVAFEVELERLWLQVKPLYDSLHCYVRARLTETYGPEVVPPGKPIPAHLLGNLWAQQWGNVYELVEPKGVADPGYALTERLEKAGYDPIKMVKTGEAFFTSLGLAPLPETFWERSMFVKPRDRDVVCHASAWSVDQKDDLRIKMCIQVNEEDFNTIHHELGHNFYQRAHNTQDPLFRDGANDGFHEALGDTLALSVTPKYLIRLGLIDKEPPADADVALLLRQALDKVAFLPFGLVIDKWRWGVFSGRIPADRYNQAWWDLKLKYQGVAPPSPRSEAQFDPGAKYHVPGNTPYMRYFLAHILQFQFHRDLTAAAGETGPLHRRSIYGSRVAGERIEKMMLMGASKPWPDALETLTGSRDMDASAVLEYFAPLKTWLDEQNRGQVCGWQ